MEFLRSIQLRGFLSFPADAATVLLQSLNVIIGPNGSGKSNFIEAIELLHAAPTAFAAAIRDGGGAQEWLWKGNHGRESASIEAIIARTNHEIDLRYRLEFAASGTRTEVVDEAIEETEKRDPDKPDVYFFYRFQQGRPVLNALDASGQSVQRKLMREDLVPDESVLSQKKGSEVYPEITWLGQQFSKIQIFREWSFGRYVALRQAQPTELANEILLPDSRNLGLILNDLEHTDAGTEFDSVMRRFLPNYVRVSTKIEAGGAKIHLRESGLKAPVSATRLSDGTLRFMAILALLLSPTPPPLICIEEPELGLHPDAVGLLSDLLIDASTRTQLIVTTHSDVLVSGLSERADTVLICENRGGTSLERVDPERLESWLEKYRLGEIWRIGELGGNP